MPTLNITATAVQYKGLEAVTAKHNATLDAEATPLTPEQYAQEAFGKALDSYADNVLTIPSSAFVMRLTTEEITNIMTAAQVDAEVKKFVDRVLSEPRVRLTYEPVVEGLNAVEAAGLIGPGRAAEILTP